ncbi:MAG TPA: GntR family transcriptional regulator [Rhodopila sp.]
MRQSHISDGNIMLLSSLAAGGQTMLLRDSIYQAIRSAVLTCEFQPGQELREQVLAERYRVSRSPVRDSLLRLEQENLVMVMPRQGYRVKPISIPDARDIFGLHQVIEPACAAKGAVHADNIALQALDRFRGFTPEAESAMRFIEYNRLFHRAIAELSNNLRMRSVAYDLGEQLERLALISVSTHDFEHVPKSCAEHEGIIDALQARDGDRAARLCFEHSARSEERVIAALHIVVQQEGNSAAEPNGATRN